MRQLSLQSKFIYAILGALVVAIGASWHAASASNKARHDFDVHSAGQGQRVQNIEKSIIRIEATQERMEDMLRKEGP
jgi:hypothetical protein